MAVKIRLARVGTRNKPFYRIVVADGRSPRDGRFIEMVGTYDPTVKPPHVSVKRDRIDYWLGKGALPTPTVDHLYRKTATAEKVDASES